MADKYLKWDSSGKQNKEVEFTTSSAGAGDSGKGVGLNAEGNIDETMLPTGVGPDVKSINASENLSAGDFVNVWDDVGTTKIRKADASSSKRAHGFVLDAVTSGSSGSVYFDGINDQLTGLTGGSMYYLSDTTAGGNLDTPPSDTGDLVQELGVAISATEITFEPTMPIELA